MFPGYEPSVEPFHSPAVPSRGVEPRIPGSEPRSCIPQQGRTSRSESNTLSAVRSRSTGPSVEAQCLVRESNPRSRSEGAMTWATSRTRRECSRKATILLPWA